jgi:hypothetical protein
MTPSLQEDGSGIDSEADSHPCQDQKQDANGNKVFLPLQHRETMNESYDMDRRPRVEKGTKRTEMGVKETGAALMRFPTTGNAFLSAHT